MRRLEGEIKGLPNPEFHARIPTIEDITIFGLEGPWKTRSGASLRRSFNFPLDLFRRFFVEYDQRELNLLPVDIRGFRNYVVGGFPEAGMGGGNEFHRVRWELLQVRCGDKRIKNPSVEWTFEDLYGNKFTMVQIPGMAICLPPWILHTYKVSHSQVEVEVIANTSFPEDPRDPKKYVADTYSLEDFRSFQHSLYLPRGRFLPPGSGL